MISFINKSFVYKNSAFIYTTKSLIFENKAFGCSLFLHQRKYGCASSGDVGKGRRNKKILRRPFIEQWRNMWMKGNVNYLTMCFFPFTT